MGWIMLNPSVASETLDDPTIRRCMTFSKICGYDGMFVVNLFAYRSTSPDNLKANKNKIVYGNPIIIGPDNDSYIWEYAAKAKLVVAAWGNQGSLLNRDKHVINLVSSLDLYCMGQSNTGAPKHPLYLKGDTKPVLFSLAKFTELSKGL
jgi:hypothetical protein